MLSEASRSRLAFPLIHNTLLYLWLLFCVRYYLRSKVDFCSLTLLESAVTGLGFPNFRRTSYSIRLPGTSQGTTVAVVKTVT